MMTRNVVERALIQFSGSIVCISHDRHFLNNVTNLTCEVGGGGIRLFEGNYEYYAWKKQEEKSEETFSQTMKVERKGKSDYKERKKTRNRLAWIEKRFKVIEKEINEQRGITQDSSTGDDYELLQKVMGIMNRLENEYLELMEEQEKLTTIHV
jgi:ATP-binding cassette subfamily F protein 3